MYCDAQTETVAGKIYCNNYFEMYFNGREIADVMVCLMLSSLRVFGSERFSHKFPSYTSLAVCARPRAYMVLMVKGESLMRWNLNELSRMHAEYNYSTLIVHTRTLCIRCMPSVLNFRYFIIRFQTAPHSLVKVIAKYSWVFSKPPQVFRKYLHAYI